MQRQKSQTSMKSKIALFDNGKPEYFLLFICNYNMNLEASGTLKDGANLHYICTLVRVEALHQFDTFSVEVESDIPEALTYIILGLGTYFLPVNAPLRCATE